MHFFLLKTFYLIFLNLLLFIIYRQFSFIKRLFNWNQCFNRIFSKLFAKTPFQKLILARVRLLSLRLNLGPEFPIKMYHLRLLCFKTQKKKILEFQTMHKLFLCFYQMFNQLFASKAPLFSWKLNNFYIQLFIFV